MHKNTCEKTQGTYNNSATEVKQLKIITEVDIGQHLNDHIHSLSTGSILNTGDQLLLDTFVSMISSVEVII